MSALRARLRSLALESSVGISAYAAANVLRGRAYRRPYSRADAFLRAWRVTDHWLVRRHASQCLRIALQHRGRLRTLRDNLILRDFVTGSDAAQVRSEFARYEMEDRARMRYPRVGEANDRQGDLIVLKAATAGEKGVVLIKYTEAIARFVALYEVERLVDRYMIVLEPSWWGYQDASFFLLSGSDADVVVQSQAASDFTFLEKYGFGLTPTRLGAGDWIDPAVFAPSNHEREYDIVMVSSWNPFKRHEELFRSLKGLRARGRILRTALVGYPNGWTAEHIRQLVRRHGLTDQCDIFDTVPSATVADIVSRSRLYVLLSRREGANKAMYEAMFCNTPVLAPNDHRGINREHLNEQTGTTFGGPDLSEAMVSALARWQEFSPRAWALMNTGYETASVRLNDTLATLATERGGTWNEPIAAKKNQPNLRYALEADRVRLNRAYDDLATYLRPIVL